LLSKRKRRAIFFDRDGVIVTPILRNGKPTAPWKRDEFQIKADVHQILSLIGSFGFLRILVTNQPDITHGHVSPREWRWMQSCIEQLPFDDVFICFHTNTEGCLCKKPKPGMLLEAAKKWHIDLSHSYMIGDTGADTKAAAAAGCKSILVEAPYNKRVNTTKLATLRIFAVVLIGVLPNLPSTV